MTTICESKYDPSPISNEQLNRTAPIEVQEAMSQIRNYPEAAEALYDFMAWDWLCGEIGILTETIQAGNAKRLDTHGGEVLYNRPFVYRN